MASPARFAVATAARTLARRSMATVPSSGLKERFAAIFPEKSKEIAEFRKANNNVVVGSYTVDQVYGGMRGIVGLVTETSLLDPLEGIEYRGHTLTELSQKLPKLEGADEPCAEGVFWLLLTGEVPTLEQVKAVSKEWNARASIPAHVADMIAKFPTNLHPMSQLSAAVCALQSESKFAKAYASGLPKGKYWDPIYEDAVDLIAKLPTVAASIYRHTYHDGHVAPINPELDWAANFNRMLGFKGDDFDNCMRLYLNIHADHEGGNVSAHTTHLVGSALSDPYLAFSAGMNGLAGPLHGLANQEVLSWLTKVHEKLGENYTIQELKDFIWATLKAGQVLPGYGHAVLRRTDPRFVVQNAFAKKHLPNSPWLKLVSDLYSVAPGILTEQGKTKNPFPNVDAHSGILLRHFGLTETTYYTVLFGVSRALGVLSSLVWDRALGLPLERPKSITTPALIAHVNKINAAKAAGQAAPTLEE
eukprot:m.129234 g.129234  ORF g.129234 m.129234 type:complete len:475 (-) comp52308_c0_seq1:171-1595(-)